MRLAFLTHEPFYPPSGGGSAEAPYLIEEFVRRGHEVHLFCPAFADSTAVAARFGITIHPFTRWEMGRYTRMRNLKYLLYPMALVQHAERTRCRIRREQDAGFDFDGLLAQHTISAVAAGILRKRWKAPVVLNFLDYLTGFMETWPALFTRTGFVPALNRFEMSLPRRTDAEGVMTVSTPLAERFIATGYPADRVRAIQYGYDSALFRPAEAASEATSPVVVMHGSFDQHHLGPIARKAVLKVHDVRPEVTFRFVGRETPALARFVHDVRAAAPTVRLETPGFVPYATVADLLRSASVGIVPYEASQGVHCAFVAKAVEYLGCGLPCVSTPLENLGRYFASEPALRFSGWDGTSFADAILGLLSLPDAERRTLGLAASQRVARELDWRVVASNAVDFTESRLQGR
jgi:glycosyltransferase involved in cell wall biosynthesis